MKKYKGFEISLAKQSGGKAGRGFNLTSTVRVLYRINSECVLLLKQIRFKIGTAEETKEAMKNAVNKATDYVDSGEAMKKVKACGCS
jgi:hypothetical protein